MTVIDRHIITVNNDHETVTIWSLYDHSTVIVAFKKRKIDKLYKK